MAKSPKLSKASRDRIEEFDEAAKSWGYTSDQGSGRSVPNSEAEYNRTKKALEKRCLHLEKKASRSQPEYRVTSLSGRIQCKTPNTVQRPAASQNFLIQSQGVPPTLAACDFTALEMRILAAGKFPELDHKLATPADRVKIDGNSNVERADIAKETLTFYYRDENANDADCAVIDLLTELMHMCRINDMNFDGLLETAYGHFTLESNVTEPTEDPYNGPPKEENAED